MICPRCKKRRNLLEFIPLMVIEEYEDQTNPIYKCPSCRWAFSPGVDQEDLAL